MATLEERLAVLITDLGADTGLLLAALTPSGVQPTVSLDSSDDQVTEMTIVDDGTATTGWPNRWEWKFDPAGATAAQLVQWVNEYGELRLVPAKDNTVALRVFGRHASTDAAHTGPLFEIQDNRADRNTVFGVDEDGNVTTTGTITIQVPSGPDLQVGFLMLDAVESVPSGTPAGTPIIRPTS